MPDKSVDEIGQEILNLLEGRRTTECFEILAAVLGTAVGGIAHMSGVPESEACRTVDLLAEDAKAHIRQHWGEIEVAH